jgi:hypothetical protein
MCLRAAAKNLRMVEQTHFEKTMTPHVRAILNPPNSGTIVKTDSIVLQLFITRRQKITRTLFQKQVAWWQRFFKSCPELN